MSTQVAKLLTGHLPILPTLGDRIAHATQSDEARAAVLQRLGINEITLKRWIAGKNKISAESAVEIADETQVPLEWLLAGQLTTFLPETTDTDVIWVPRFDVRASAGAGLTPSPAELQPRSEIAFREGWLRSLGVLPEYAQFLTAEGDSMLETIHDGDLLLINRLIDRVVSNSIYVVVLAGQVMVKRLQLLFDGSILLISDNPRYQPERVDKADVEGLQVEGRVRWYGRAI